jgi:hypothetical protein
MKNIFKLLGIIALAAVIGFSMTACDDGDDGVVITPKSIKITGLSAYNGQTGTLLLSSSADKYYLLDTIAATKTGTVVVVEGGTLTAPLYKIDSPVLGTTTDKRWTGLGSYYVIAWVGSNKFVTKSKKSFVSPVTTLSLDDFETTY